MSRVVLSVAAHGSDAEFMAGGSLAKLASDGHDVYLAVCTDNRRSSHRLTARDLIVRARTEAETAAAALGAEGIFMLGYPEGELCDLRPSILRDQVMHLIRQVRASIVFSWDPHAPFEGHPDHRAIAWATSDAARLSHLPLYHPEQPHAGDNGVAAPAPQRVSEWYWYSKAGWGTNKRVNITDTMDQKLAALRAYDSQTAFLLDEFLAEARLSNADESELAAVDPANHGEWLEMTVRAICSRLGAAEGAAYVEAFRYESLAERDLLQSL
jgi:LmbE family N-acetylglucosaminyl deacetylase